MEGPSAATGRLVSAAAEIAGLPVSTVDAWTSDALALDAPGRRGGHSQLNNNGEPLQLCIGVSATGHRVRLIADPAWFLGEPAARLVAGRGAVRRTLPRVGASSLTPLCERTIASVLPDDGGDLQAFGRGVLWLAFALAGDGAAVYVDTRPLAGDEAWLRAGDWACRLLADPGPVVDTLATLRGGARLASLGIEGLGPRRARAKVYWRLRSGVSLADLGLADAETASLAGFLTATVGERAIRLGGIVLSRSFRLPDGAAHDLKVDLCAHCLPQSPGAWAATLDRLCGELALPPLALGERLRTGGCEMAFLGFGRDRDGAARLNVYLRPRVGDGQPWGRRLVPAAAGAAVDRLLALQGEDGGFTGFRDLPVGAATEWVTAYAGLALAAASTWRPEAAPAAHRAADFLVERRSYAAGWGYNSKTGPDADSTGLALRLLRATGRPPAAADLSWLLARWRDGGFATYPRDDAWGEPHPCVTAQ
ncbi:MAG TPA: hypothetical protein VKU40_19515, partial [Thermoanaerobaculia bacterium]|nr:hypothetical protein [Thermoanaerobaculia bacterium]